MIQNHLNLCSKNEAIFWQFPFTFTKMRKNAQTIQIPDQNCEKKAKVWFHIEKYVSSLRSYNWKTRPCLTLKTICMSFRSHSDRKVQKGRKFDDESLRAAQSLWFSLIIFPHVERGNLQKYSVFHLIMIGFPYRIVGLCVWQ